MRLRRRPTAGRRGAHRSAPADRRPPPGRCGEFGRRRDRPGSPDMIGIVVRGAGAGRPGGDGLPVHGQGDDDRPLLVRPARVAVDHRDSTPSMPPSGPSRSMTIKKRSAFDSPTAPPGTSGSRTPGSRDIDGKGGGSRRLRHSLRQGDRIDAGEPLRRPGEVEADRGRTAQDGADIRAHRPGSGCAQPDSEETDVQFDEPTGIVRPQAPSTNQPARCSRPRRGSAAPSTDPAGPSCRARPPPRPTAPLPSAGPGNERRRTTAGITRDNSPLARSPGLGPPQASLARRPDTGGQSSHDRGSADKTPGAICPAGYTAVVAVQSTFSLPRRLPVSPTRGPGRPRTPPCTSRNSDASTSPPSATL